MSLQEFINQVVERLKADLGEIYQIDKNETVENNGIPKYGVRVRKREQKEPMVTFYLGEDYTRFRSAEDFEDCIGELKRRIDKIIGQGQAKELRTIVPDWNRIKRHIFPMVINTEKNEELMKKVIHRPFLDMTVMFRAVLGEIEEGWMYVDMDDDLLEMWNVTRQELEELSYANLEREGGRLYLCGELKEGAFNGKIEEISPGTALQENYMYILTNEEQMYGAAQILNRQLLRKMAGGCNLYLLPCSVHELIVLVDDGSITSGELSKVMQDIEISMKEETLLQEHPYYYDFARDEILSCS